MVSDSHPAAGGSPTAGFAFVLLATILVITDFLVADAVIPALARDLDLSVSDLGLGFTAYFATAAALMVLTGRLGDALGRRRILLGALLLFVAGSIVTSLARDETSFLLGRVLVGFAVAAILPAALGILHALFPDPGARRERAFARWATAIGVAAVVGPLVGGVAASAISWRWAFVGTVPVAIVAAVGIRVTLPESRRRLSRGVDLVGTVLLAIAAAALALAADVGGRKGWGGARDVIFGPRASPGALLLVTGVAAAVAFAAVERGRARRGREIAAPTGLYRLRTFRAATVSSAFMNIGDTGFQLVLPLVAGFSLGIDETGVGTVLACYGAGVTGGGLLAGRLARRLDNRRVTRIALAVLPLLLVALLPLLSRTSSLAPIGALLVAYGLAWGVAYARLVSASYEEVPERDAAVAGGMQTATRFLAGALGAALLTAVFAGVSVSHISSDADLDGVTRDRLAQEFDPSPRAVNSHQRLDGRPPERSGADAEADAVDAAYAAGARATIVVAAVITGAALLVALRLPRTSQPAGARPMRSRTASRNGCRSSSR